MSSQKSWVVKVECTVNREVICENCTESEARENPFDYAISERDIDMPDWDVKSVKPNE